MNRLARLVLSAVFTLSVAVPAAAQQDSPTLARITKSGELRVGMTGSQPPLNFRSKSGDLMGLEVDLATALAGMMGAKLKIVEKPFGELIGAVQKGEVDLVLSGMTITAERNMKVAFVGPYHISGKSILTKSSTLAQADETSDLNQAGISLAALAGSTSQAFVERLVPNAKLVTTTDYDEAVKLLVDGKVEAMVADFEICMLTAYLNPKEQLVALDTPLTIEPIGVAVAPGDSLLINFLVNSLGALETAEVMNALRARWIGQGDWVSELP